MRALIIDDEKEICQLLSSMLTKLGFETDFANNLSGGSEKLHESKYDVVIIDINLPDGLGFHLIENVVNHNTKAKIIIISAYDGNIERQRVKSEGAHFFIPKPFNKKMVIDALEKLDVNYQH